MNLLLFLLLCLLQACQGWNTLLPSTPLVLSTNATNVYEPSFEVTPQGQVVVTHWFNGYTVSTIQVSGVQDITSWTTIYPPSWNYPGPVRLFPNSVTGTNGLLSFNYGNAPVNLYGCQNITTSCSTWNAIIPPQLSTGMQDMVLVKSTSALWASDPISENMYFYNITGITDVSALWLTKISQPITIGSGEGPVNMVGVSALSVSFSPIFSTLYSSSLLSLSVINISDSTPPTELEVNPSIAVDNSENYRATWLTMVFGCLLGQLQVHCVCFILLMATLGTKFRIHNQSLDKGPF